MAHSLALVGKKEWAGFPGLPQVGHLVAGRYRVGAELGRGGMCRVVAAEDEMLGRSVALKVLLPQLATSAEAVKRFDNEARSLARIESAHVVRVLDIGRIQNGDESQGLPFMVLELLKGEDLFTHIAEEGQLSAESVARIALQACDGLAAAHAAGIVHRDLKPENLFIASGADGSKTLKVLDFGIARVSGERLTQEAMGVGSPGYMSPEQVCSASDVDQRTDIWSLGVVLYELLAGRPAFSGANVREICMRILNAPITPLEQLRPDLPAALVYVIERCLERDPLARFQNVAELAEALGPLDLAASPSGVDRIRRRLAQRSGISLVMPVASRGRKPANSSLDIDDMLRDTQEEAAPVAGRASAFELRQEVAARPSATPARRRSSAPLWVAATSASLAAAFALLPVLPIVNEVAALKPAVALSVAAAVTTERVWNETRGLSLRTFDTVRKHVHFEFIGLGSRPPANEASPPVP